MRSTLPIYTVFCLFITFCLTACGSGGESANNNNTANDTAKIVDSLKKTEPKVDTTTEEFKASALVMYSDYTQHIPHFEKAETFTPDDKLKQEVPKHTETCKDESKQVWKKNKQGYMKCDCGGVENYVIFSPQNEWLYVRHLTNEKKLADFQPAMDKASQKFDSTGTNQIFKVVIAKGSWYEVVNNKSDNTWWFDKNLKELSKFLE